MRSGNSKSSEALSFYLAMLNALAEVRQALEHNDAPEEAKSALDAAIESCQRDYQTRFGR
ncbi:MAG TPA: hypothetical protein VNR86_04650 [Sphingomicrobium sp.]|nr:hypothetical protein [Sphingomicrobium sp.]